MHNYVGKLHRIGLGLRNTYKFESGLLIPVTESFFDDSCAHAIGGIQAVLRANEFIKEINASPEKRKETKEDKGLQDSYNSLEKISMEPSYNQEVDFAKKVVDEILAIASPKDSYGLVKTIFKGKFDEASIYFFNPPNLKELFNLISLQHFDYSLMKPTGNFDRLFEYWSRLREQCNVFALTSETSLRERKSLGL